MDELMHWTNGYNCDKASSIRNLNMVSKLSCYESNGASFEEENRHFYGQTIEIQN